MMETQDQRINPDPMQITTLNRYQIKLQEKQRLMEMLEKESQDNKRLMDVITLDHLKA